MRFAIDTNILLDWANGYEDIPDCFNLIKERIPGITIIVPPTVLHELGYFAQYGTKGMQESSRKALVLIRDEPMLRPLNLVPVGHGIVEINALKIRAKGLIDEDEKHDSFILVEAGLLECSVLLTNDSHLTAIDSKELAALMKSFDCTSPIITTPRHILNKFSPARSKPRR